MSQSNNNGMGCLVFVGIIAWGGWYFATYNTDSAVKDRAAQKYHLNSEKISVGGPSPHDCDFMTAPLGSKHCHYEREYSAEWFTLSSDVPPRPISYGTIQADPPLTCSQALEDFAHKCYYIDKLQDGESATQAWSARSLRIQWRKIED